MIHPDHEPMVVEEIFIFSESSHAHFTSGAFPLDISFHLSFAPHKMHRIFPLATHYQTVDFLKQHVDRLQQGQLKKPWGSGETTISPTSRGSAGDYRSKWLTENFSPENSWHIPPSHPCIPIPIQIPIYPICPSVHLSIPPCVMCPHNPTKSFHVEERYKQHNHCLGCRKSLHFFLLNSFV